MVPDGWKNQSPTSLFKLFSGFAFKSTDAQESGTKWLKIANVGIGEIKWDADSFLPEHFLLEHKKFALSKGDIVVALTRPTLGNKLKVARLTKESDTSLLNQRVAKIVCKDDGDSEFVFQLLRSDEFAYRINVGLLGTDPPNLSVKVLEDFTVGCPPLPEQRKIAKILSTWDKAIATTEKLIEASKQQKKALMQQLLTGKKRLINPETGKAFEGEWEEVKLGDVCSKVTDGAHHSPQSVEVGYPMFSVKDMRSTGFFENTARHISDGDFKALVKQNCKPEINDILIAKDGSILKYCFVVKEEVQGVILSSIALLRPKLNKIFPQFIAQYFSQDSVKFFVGKALTSGSGVPRIILKDFKGIHIRIPSVPEQQKIASVLTAADQEIEMLEAKLAHFKQEKKALMQQLLTGKRRVTVDIDI
ncbi:restriction endonuclease subunit S [Marinomonas sp. 2405UD66-6]|uniref:restriction endonuclease subunit S n=1 Tax=Marinomonas sp. 2405UD66-6 TaxID=3391834 RepID=UPI0039C9804A